MCVYDIEMPPQHDHGQDKNMMMMMHMNFYWGKDAIVLFSGWPNHNLGMYVLAIFFVFLLSAAAEFLSVRPVVVKRGTNPVLGGLTQAGIYAFRISFLYLVMLSVMSFNLGIFIAAVVGHTVGFFIVKVGALASANKADTDSFTIPKV
ncbi:putative Copper transporter [Quillaja saponaria]|uniref:Copper transport protein n=1 Tax=Quillaja saponaria TaxID=32244 RepID=A0AAD7PC95_QUISA|nr:putative Copper transporter [Quillaja saponaria]